MSQFERECIAVGFDNDSNNMIPMIKLDAAGSMRKIIQGVSGIKNIDIYHINFMAQKTEKIGNIPWPDKSLKADIIIDFKPEEMSGTVQIGGTDAVWSYSMEDTRRFREDINKKQKEGETKNTELIDKNKLKEIKEKQNLKKEVWPEEIADPIKQVVYGQDTAIDAVADAIIINQMQKEDKLLVLAFMGPPATGKSTVGRTLADILSKVYGESYGFLEIAASEYTQEHMVQKFLGAPAGYVGHGGKTVLEPVRRNPYHVILINEIEKAHEKMLLALMEAMDTGYLGMADNSPSIDLNHSILVFTSNIPIDMQEYYQASEFQRSELCKDAFTKECGRPEISRRIQDFMVFTSLSEDAQIDVIVKFAKKALADMDAELVKIDEHLMADFLKHKTKYGASELGNYVTKAIGRKMLKTRQKNFVSGKKVMLSGSIDNIEFKFM